MWHTLSQDYLPSLHDRRKTWLKCQWQSSRSISSETPIQRLLRTLVSKSLPEATPYLVAVHLHDWCPSSIPASEISHVTENGCRLWIKDNCNHPSFATQRRHFLVNNYSRLVSSIKSASLLSGGRGFKPWPGQHSGSLKWLKRKCCDIFKQLNRSSRLTAPSGIWFLWDAKEPTPLFEKSRGLIPRWCGQPFLLAWVDYL